MQLTASRNTAISETLDVLGIKYELNEIFFIDRTSMVTTFLLDEQASYNATMDFVRDVCPGLRVMWVGRNDDWMSLAVYET